MASLANLPKLRRTLTDVMEDELYHIPNQTRSSSSSPTLQHALLASTLKYHQSQELLNIPDAFTEAHNNIMANATLIEDDYDDEDMLIDDDVEDSVLLDPFYTPGTYNVQPFHDYANPNVFNSYNNHLHQQTYIHQDPFQNSFELPNTVSPRDAHIKLPEELLNADSNNALFNATYDPSRVFVWQNERTDQKQNIGPEQLYLDEISDDEEEEDMDDEDLMDTDLNYYDINDQTYSPPSSPSNSHGAHDDDAGNLKSSPLSFNMDDILPLAQNEYNDRKLFEKEETDDAILDEEKDIVSVKQELQDNNTLITPSPNQSTGGRVGRKQSFVGTLSPDGLHQCQLTNPATHKPCLKQFSRPYDLVRHQETIHASKKKIYRCTLCEDDFNKHGNSRLSNKTFSRGDALSRHIRVKHGLTGVEANELIRIAKENVEYIDVQ